MADLAFLLQPNVYSTMPGVGEIGKVLAELWGEAHADATLYASSAFVDQNGVLPFVKLFKEHVESGGTVKCFFAGSASQRMTSRQAVAELLAAKVDVRLLNRKKIFHVKMYGYTGGNDEGLLVGSGNFTGSGLGLNVESALVVRGPSLRSSGFSWGEWEKHLTEVFDWHQPLLETFGDATDPAWKLTFDETRGRPTGDDDSDYEEILVFTLSPTDVRRVNDPAAVGTQYFWLSRYVAGYFPTLTVRSASSAKRTFSTMVDVEFLDLKRTERVSVTFEAYNNLDFRLLTSPLRRTGLAKEGDFVILERTGPANYRLKIIPKGTRGAARLSPYLIHEVGHRGKRYGMVPKSLGRGLL